MSFDLVFTDVNLATMQNNSLSEIPNAILAVKEGKIAWVGPGHQFSDEFLTNARHIIEGRGQWLLPGLIDCHTHLVYSGSRANEFVKKRQGMSYANILAEGGGIHATVRATRAASFDELLRDSLARLTAKISQGVTTCEIKSGYGLDMHTEIKMLQVARELAAKTDITVPTTFLGAHVCPKEYSSHTDYINFVIDEVLPRVVEKNLADAIDIFCDSVGFGLSDTEKLFNAAAKYKLPVKIHAEQLSLQGGASLATKFKALSADHLEYLDEEGIKAMGKAGTVAVLLPGAYYFLQAKEKPQIELFKNYGVKIAIATDTNPGSCPSTNLLLMLNMGSILFNLTVEDVLLGVTINAAHALGLQSTKGSLEIGKDADLSLWPVYQIEELVYRMGDNPGCRVFHRGIELCQK